MVERLTEIPLLWPPHTLAALGEGDKWALLEVLFEELADSLIHLGTFAGCLTRFQRLSSLGFGGVTLVKVEIPTPKVRAAWALGLPLSMTSTIF